MKAEGKLGGSGHADEVCAPLLRSACWKMVNRPIRRVLEDIAAASLSAADAAIAGLPNSRDTGRGCGHRG